MLGMKFSLARQRSQQFYSKNVFSHFRHIRIHEFKCDDYDIWFRKMIVPKTSLILFPLYFW